MKLKLVGVLVAALAVLVSVSTARADTLTVGDIQFTGTVTATTATLTVQCTNNAVCGGFFLGDVTLKGFTDTTASAGTASGGYTFVNGGQNNDAVASGGGCNGNDTGGAVCFDAPTTLDKLGTTLYTFTATLTGGVAPAPGTLHVQATWYDNDTGTQQGGQKFAISDDLNGAVLPPPPPTVPEPSSLGLLGLGLLSLAVFTLRRPVANLI